MTITSAVLPHEIVAVVAPTRAASDDAIARVLRRALRSVAIIGGLAPNHAAMPGGHIIGSAVPTSVTTMVSAVAGSDEQLAARISLESDRIVVHTDAVGLSHVCWGQVEGVTIASNSALVVAGAIDATLDPRGVAMMAFMGFVVGGATLFGGVRRLQAGERVVVTHDGNVDSRRFGVDAHRDLGPADARRDEVAMAAHGAAVLRRVVAGLVAAHPQAVMELSGGLDSRAVLAAVPAAHRRDLRTVTLGQPGDVDATVADSLARHCATSHQLIDPAWPTGPDPDVIKSRLVAAGRRRDHVFNALAAMSLDCAERAMPVGTRFTGANGEFARGYYYAGAWGEGAVTARRISQLATWRLFTNDGGAARMLDQDSVAEARDAVLASLGDTLDSVGSWRQATDEFYLTERMANWSGPSYSSRPGERVALAPFFHPDFLSWSRSLPRRLGVRNRVFARMIQDLDAQLAGISLDRGVPVDELAVAGPTARARSVRRVGIKVMKKLDQRIRGRGKPPSLVRDVVTALATWEHADSDALATTGLFSNEAVEQMGNRIVRDVATVSLGLNVAAAQRFLDTVRRGSPDAPDTNES